MIYEQALKILGLSPDNSMAEIKKRYRSLMLMTHPDVANKSRYPYDASEINVAYEYLFQNYGIIKNKEEQKKHKVRWNAPINNNAYAARDIYHYVENAYGDIIAEATIARGKFMWIADEDFSLLLKSLFHCSKTIIQEADEKMQRERSDDIRLLSEICYLLAQQYVDSERILSLLPVDVTENNEKVYHTDAMLEICGRYSFKDGEWLCPMRFQSHRLYVCNKEKQEIGYISFKDDRLYYGIIPLLERRKAWIKIVVKDKKYKKLNEKNYVNVLLYLKIEEEDKSTMIENVNYKIDMLLNKTM